MLHTQLVLASTVVCTDTVLKTSLLTKAQAESLSAPGITCKVEEQRTPNKAELDAVSRVGFDAQSYDDFDDSISPELDRKTPLNPLPPLTSTYPAPLPAPGPTTLPAQPSRAYDVDEGGHTDTRDPKNISPYRQRKK